MLVAGKWIQYDDDNPIPQREEDIVKLSGGGKGSKSISNPVSTLGPFIGTKQDY